MSALLDSLKYVSPILVVGLTIYSIKLKKRTKDKDVFNEFVLNTIESQKEQNKALSELLESHNETVNLIRDISLTVNKKFNQIVIDNDNVASMLKEELFNNQGRKFVKVLAAIYEQNGIVDKKEFVMDKIQSAIKDLLHKTDEKLKSIPNMEMYLVDFNDFLKDVEETGVYDIIYNIMYDIKTDNDKIRGSKVGEFKKRASSVYKICTQKLAEKYTF